MIQRHLPYFAVVAEEQHFQRAADRLGITQSALSRRIQLLEQELGITLFERTTRGARLSPAGISFYHDVRTISRDLDKAVDRARQVMKGDVGTIKVGINPSAAASPAFVAVLETFRRENPDVVINFDMLYSDEQVDALKNRQLDFGFLYRFRAIPELELAELSLHRLLLLLPREHALATAPHVSITDLETIPFVWPRRLQAPSLYDWMIATCHRAGFSPQIQMEVQTVDSVVNFVAIGVGVGFVMEHQLLHLPDAVVARRVDGFDLEVSLCLGWRSDARSPMLPHLLDVVRRVRT